MVRPEKCGTIPPSLIDTEFLLLSGGSENDDGTSELAVKYSLSNAQSMVWTTIALNAADQLRQRMAWALSQIYVIGREGLDNHYKQQELWHAYYDIFVRNAFGNLRDVLKEVPAACQLLTFVCFSTYEGLTLTVRALRDRHAFG